MCNKNVAACIVLYNPDLSRLKENISAIYPQVDFLVLVDNGSQNYSQIAAEYGSYEKIALIDLSCNLGIACALNCACNQAVDKGYKWIITLDQDSVSSEGLVEKYLRYAAELPDAVGQLTCNIVDRNRPVIKQQMQPDFYEVDWCITSGTCVNLSAWEDVGGFDEKMFIDGVDTDFGLALKRNGYKTIHINFDGLLHEVGKVSKVIHLFGSEHPVYNHNAKRRYYITRNSIYLALKYDEISMAKTICRVIGRTFLVLVFEDKKISKLKASLKGIHDGFSLQ